jgi:electron transport complex protein RnfB
VPSTTPADSLARRIDKALPQTQCTRCGYPDCSGYASAIAAGQADINQCPPGGAQGIVRLAAITGRDAVALNPANGSEGPRKVFYIDEAWCIGCTLCIKACPVDCIIGAPKVMHTVIEDLCTGCELCVPACPVDCILSENAATGPLPETGWSAWSPALADQARQRYAAHRTRAQRDAQDNDARLATKAEHKLADLPAASAITDAAALERKRAAIDAAVQRARERKNAITKTER